MPTQKQKQEIALQKIDEIFTNQIIPIIYKYKIADLQIENICEHCQEKYEMTISFSKLTDLLSEVH